MSARDSFSLRRRAWSRVIRRQLEERDWSQRELAEEMELREDRISDWVTKKHLASPKNFSKVAKAFRMTGQELDLEVAKEMVILGHQDSLPAGAMDPEFERRTPESMHPSSPGEPTSSYEADRSRLVAVLLYLGLGPKAKGRILENAAYWDLADQVHRSLATLFRPMWILLASLRDESMLDS